MSSSPPTTLGRYQIIREIARSNDIVYEAWDPGMNRRVALKELALPSGATQSQREDRLKRFLREARAAGSLTHPNIVTVFEVGEDQGRTFIAMEYLDGRTLRAEIDQSGFLPPMRCLEIAQEILKGLAFAHSKGVIHRDIKPENIQLLEGGAVKITDFGIARLTFEPNITMDGQVFGTPSYMSPEQIGGKDLDARSDLFSVGIILYEALSGQKAFPGDSVVSITYAIMNKEPEFLPSIPYPLWQVVEQALNKIPSMRFPSAETMRSALARATISLGSDTSPGPQMPSVFGTGAPPVQQPQPYQQPPQQTGWQPGQVLAQPYQPGGYGGQQTQTPYSPYTPYQPGQPAPPPMMGGGIGQPYTPYQSPMGSAQGGPPPIPGVTGVGFPVYYPPPPRRPLMTINPETVKFLVRLVLAIAISVTLVALVISLLKHLAELPEARQVSISSPTRATSVQPRPFTSPDAGAFRTSEPSAQPASQTPPPSAASVDELWATGVRMAQEAAQEPLDADRRRLWNDASTAFLEAAAADPRRSASVRQGAVRTLLDIAEGLASQGNLRRAREAAQAADGVAAGSPELQQTASEALARYGAS